MSSSKLIQRWSEDVRCECGAEGHEWGYRIDGDGTSGCVVSPMACACPGWTPFVFTFLWSYPIDFDPANQVRGVALSFADAITQLIQMAKEETE